MLKYRNNKLICFILSSLFCTITFGQKSLYYNIDSCIFVLKNLGKDKYAPGFYDIKVKILNKNYGTIAIPLRNIDYELKNKSIEVANLIAGDYLHEPYTKFKLIATGKKGIVYLNTRRIEELQNFKITYLKNFVFNDSSKKSKVKFVQLQYEDIDTNTIKTTVINDVKF